MAKHKKYNPEKRAWFGKSYKAVRILIRDLRERAFARADRRKK